MGGGGSCFRRLWAGWLWAGAARTGAAGGGSAHAISCFFLFDVCSAAVWSRRGRLRTRHFLLFSFWRVQRGSLEPAGGGSGRGGSGGGGSGRGGSGGGGSAHVISCFFLFDVCDTAVWSRRGRLRTRHFLLFSF